MFYRHWCIFIFLIISSSFKATIDDSTLTLSRIYFNQARTSEIGAINLKLLTEQKQDKSIYKAYHGAAYTFLAKYTWNPVKKLENVNKGLNLLNESVMMNDEDVEIRFLRLAIEENLPPVISFKGHIKADKNYIIAHLHRNHTLYQVIRNYLLSSKSINEADRKIIQ